MRRFISFPTNPIENMLAFEHARERMFRGSSILFGKN